MTEIQKALSQISEIHEHLARTEVYRGYRSVPLALAGIVGVVAAALQPAILPTGSSRDFVAYWTWTAGIAFFIAMSGGIIRFVFKSDLFQRRRSLYVNGQFLPCLIAGACLTLVMEPQGEQAIRFLPGLWSILFAMGNFAARPFLPHGIGWLAFLYLVAGLILLVLAESGKSLSPWGMGLTFGGGQLAAAAILYWSLERGETNAEE